MYIVYMYVNIAVKEEHVPVSARPDLWPDVSGADAKKNMEKCFFFFFFFVPFSFFVFFFRGNNKNPCDATLYIAFFLLIMMNDCSDNEVQ